jgi:hypothetical protein
MEYEDECGLCMRKNQDNSSDGNMGDIFHYHTDVEMFGQFSEDCCFNFCHCEQYVQKIVASSSNQQILVIWTICVEYASWQWNFCDVATDFLAKWMKQECFHRGGTAWWSRRLTLATERKTTVKKRWIATKASSGWYSGLLYVDYTWHHKGSGRSSRNEVWSWKAWVFKFKKWDVAVLQHEWETIMISQQ